MKNSILLSLVSIYCIYRISSIVINLRESVALDVVFLDVGQGDAILLNLKDNKPILIDGGYGYTIDFLLAEYFDTMSCHFDSIIATHLDSDHIGGIERILSRCKFNHIWINDVMCD